MIDEIPLSGRVREVKFHDGLQMAVAVSFQAEGLDLIPYAAEGAGDEDFYRINPTVGDDLVITTRCQVACPASSRTHSTLPWS